MQNLLQIIMRIENLSLKYESKNWVKVEFAYV